MKSELKRGAFYNREAITYLAPRGKDVVMNTFLLVRNAYNNDVPVSVLADQLTEGGFIPGIEDPERYHTFATIFYAYSDRKPQWDRALSRWEKQILGNRS